MTQKIALITGASRGLGHALAQTLTPQYHIIAVGRTVGALEELDDIVKSKGGRTTIAPMDIASKEAMAQLCRSIYERWSTIDLWAHTAIHATPLGPAHTIDSKDMDKSIEINITACARLIQYVAPLLQETSDVLFFDDEHIMGKFHSAYAASKSAQMTLARHWQRESAKVGPKVHICNPPAMRTATRARFFPGEDRSKLSSPEEAVKQIWDAQNQSPRSAPIMEKE